MDGPGGGPNLTPMLENAQNIILGYLNMGMPWALTIGAVIIGIYAVKRLIAGFTK